MEVLKGMMGVDPSHMWQKLLEGMVPVIKRVVDFVKKISGKFHFIINVVLIYGFLVQKKVSKYLNISLFLYFKFVLTWKKGKPL